MHLTQPSIFTLYNVTKVYDRRCVLQVDSLSILRGEILAVVGPSGTGKSTLLRLLNFLEPPTSGEIHFEDQPFGPSATVPLATRRRITTVFQRPALLSRSVYDNVRYGLSLRRQTVARGSDDPAQAALEQVGLQDLAKQSATKLSGGEMQRVALARALVIEPDVLLLDEPTANLDPQNVALIESIVKSANEKSGVTAVLVTHNLFQARRLADRVLLLLEGRVVEIAPTEQFFEEPQDVRTAAFVRGEMIY